MVENVLKPKAYIYKYSYHEDEQLLCHLEMRSFFGVDSSAILLESPIDIEPSRSPFIKEKIGIIYDGNTIDELAMQVKDLKIDGTTFKIIFINNEEQIKVPFSTRREIERTIGLQINGTVDLVHPQLILAIMKISEDRWVLGTYCKSEAIWFQHQDKPHNYSTALSTRVARAVVNIAVPYPSKIKVIDPCCGIGTVLIEALSMGIDIVGSDINPLVLTGTRENITYFGFSTEVRLQDIRNVCGNYDVAIIDMPYNLCSVLTEDEKLNMLVSARKFTKKIVIITVETIDYIIKKAGFTINDRCVVKKGNVFKRQVIVCT